MPRAVIILGAGASADFGVPTLASVFKDRQSRIYLHQNPEILRMLEETFWRVRGHSLESSDQSLTVEEMLTTLRDWEQEPGLPAELRPANLPAFRRKLYVLIERAVFEGKSTRSEHLNPLISICRQKFEHTTWASFNWDCIFESSFWYSQPYLGPGSRINPSLGIPMANWRPGSSRHLFLKLHGAINWWMISGTLTYLPWSAGGDLAQKWTEFDSNPAMQDRPVILEPSFYKYQDDSYDQLRPQWERFFDELLRADCVIIVGYSLPDSDSLARSKILTAFQVRPTCKWLMVDPSDSVRDRYRRLFGTEGLKIHQTTLAGFNNAIRQNLQEAFPEIDFSEPPHPAPAPGA